MIYTLPDEAIDKIVDDYIDYATNSFNIRRQPKVAPSISIYPEKCRDNTPAPVARGLKYIFTTRISSKNEPEEVVQIENLPKPNRVITFNKFKSLLHILFIRFINSKTGDFTLNTSTLQKVYPYYNYMLDCLNINILTSTTPIDITGKVKYSINNPKQFIKEETSNIKIIKDIEANKSAFDKLRKNEQAKLAKATSNYFLDRYNYNLKRLEFNDPLNVQSFIDNFQFKSDHQRLYYENYINKINNKEFKEVDSYDSNGRIYHIGTALPRSLREYTNINFIVDCKNSQPCLLNYLLIDYYTDRSIDISYNFKKNIVKKYFLNFSLFIKEFDFKFKETITYKTIINDDNTTSNIEVIKHKPIIYFNNTHYSIKNLHNSLKDSINEKSIYEKLAKVPVDVLAYIKHTLDGTFWDDFMTVFPDISRIEVKQKLFESIFYNLGTKVYSDDVYGMAFKSRYPNVMKVIRFYKKRLHKHCQDEDVKKNKKGKDGVQLAHLMTRLESAIFTEILTALFRKRDLYCFGIHDSIAVINDTYTPEFITEKMMAVYHRYGFSPTLSVDYYSK